MSGMGIDKFGVGRVPFVEIADGTGKKVLLAKARGSGAYIGSICR